MPKKLPKKSAKFLEELTKLTNKYGIWIEGIDGVYIVSGNNTEA